MRCACARCAIIAALELLLSGRTDMAITVLEGVLETEKHRPGRPKLPRRASKAGGARP